VAASEYWRNLCSGLIIYSQIWPPVRFDHSGLFPQNSGKRGGGLGLTSYHMCVGGDRKQRSSQDYQLCSTGPDNSHLVSKGFQLFCVWGRRHLSQGQFPAIQAGCSSIRTLQSVELDAYTSLTERCTILYTRCTPHFMKVYTHTELYTYNSPNNFFRYVSINMWLSLLSFSWK
jgi:hypothetical protein